MNRTNRRQKRKCFCRICVGYAVICVPSAGWQPMADGWQGSALKLVIAILRLGFKRCLQGE